jgi:hypothetical protein
VRTGATVKYVLFHHAMENLPFGRVGASGMAAITGSMGSRRLVMPVRSIAGPV